MTRLMKGKLIGVAAACLLVVSLVVAGATAPATLAQDSPSVSIDPATTEVGPGGTFSVDVVVDSDGLLVKGCGVTVTFNPVLTATDATGLPLLGDPVLSIPTNPGIAVGEVSWDVVRTGDNDPAAVEGDFMTIDFSVDPAAVGIYSLVIEAILVDENGDEIPGVVLTDGVVDTGIPGVGPSVSIDPPTQTVDAPGTFSVDVVVDSDGLLVKACAVAVTFDADLTATDATGLALLGDPVLAIPTTPGIAVGEVSWDVVRTGDNDPAAVEGDFMTIDFSVDPAAADTYILAVEATLLDENNDPIPGVVETGGVVVIGVPGPVEFEKTFGPTALGEGVRDPIWTIPGGVADLRIDLSAEASPEPDMDLELYDGTTLVIGWKDAADVKAKIYSKGSITDTYAGDTFSYSGWDGGEEDIEADSVSQPYDLEVFAYEAGTYTVTVSYVILGPDSTPPVITIEGAVDGVLPPVSLGDPVTITVSATDDVSGVLLTAFAVWPEEYPEWWQALAIDNPIVAVSTYEDEASVTFVPGWLGTYTVWAGAVDREHNMTSPGAPGTTATFEVE